MPTRSRPRRTSSRGRNAITSLFSPTNNQPELSQMFRLTSEESFLITTESDDQLNMEETILTLRHRSPTEKIKHECNMYGRSIVWCTLLLLFVVYAVPTCLCYLAREMLNMDPHLLFDTKSLLSRWLKNDVYDKLGTKGEILILDDIIIFFDLRHS